MMGEDIKVFFILHLYYQHEVLKNKGDNARSFSQVL